MEEVIAEFDYVPVSPLWSVRPVFWAHRDKPEQAAQVTIQLFHTCGGSERKFPRREYCVLQNKAAFLRGHLPIYACTLCGETAPTFVVEKKILAAKSYAGYDPRNNRRAAVLATKNKGTKNV